MIYRQAWIMAVQAITLYANEMIDAYTLAWGFFFEKSHARPRSDIRTWPFSSSRIFAGWKIAQRQSIDARLLSGETCLAQERVQQLTGPRFWAIFLDQSLLDNFWRKDRNIFDGSIFNADPHELQVTWRRVYNWCLVVRELFVNWEAFIKCSWRFWSKYILVGQ